MEIEKFKIDELREKLYWYNVRVDFLYDGDTITAMQLDFGFGLTRTIKRGDGDGIRFYGINTPEMNTEEGKKLAKRLKVLEGKHVICRSYRDKSGKYGRYLFELFPEAKLITGWEEEEGVCINLNQWLLEQGLAKPMK